MERLREEGAEQLADRIKLEAQLTAAAQRLGNKHRVMAEVRELQPGYGQQGRQSAWAGGSLVRKDCCGGSFMDLENMSALLSLLPLL